MNGLIDYEVVARGITEACAKEIAHWGGNVIARPMAGDPVTGVSSGNWEVIKIDAPAPRLRKFPARAGHEEQLGEVL